MAEYFRSELYGPWQRRILGRVALAASVAGFALLSHLPFYSAASAVLPPTLEEKVSALTTAPVINSIDGKLPVDGMELQALETAIGWVNPAGATQYQIKVIPFNNDGPGINLIRNVETSFTIQPPDISLGTNFVMLPGMSYELWMRVTDANIAIDENSSLWGPWVKAKFRTPVSSYTLSSLHPASSKTTGPKPILQWEAANNSIFYWEIQVSPKPVFPDDTWRWHNLFHGGILPVSNAWIVPESLPAGTYYWRVRPRIQGDGTPEQWGPAWRFTVDPSKPSDAMVYGTMFHDYNGNGTQEKGELGIQNGTATFKSTRTLEEFAALPNGLGKYATIAQQGSNQLLIAANAPESGKAMNYLFPSSSDLYLLTDANRRFTPSISGNVQELLLGLGEGKLTMPFASSIPGVAKVVVAQGFTGSSAHDGIDYAFLDIIGVYLEGIEILAAAPGTVYFAGPSPCNGETILALSVGIKHIDGTYTIYEHLKEIKPGIRVGSFVSREDVIALSGNGGYPACSKAPHLHFELGNTAIGNAINPDMDWIKKMRDGVGTFYR